MRDDVRRARLAHAAALGNRDAASAISATRSVDEAEESLAHYLYERRQAARVARDTESTP